MASRATKRINPLRMGQRTPEKGGVVGWLLSVIVLLILIGIVLYAVYHLNWQTGNGSADREVRNAISSVKNASEDAVLTSKVKTAFALSKQVSAYDINVDSNKGVVTLGGHVPSDEMRRAAEQIARDTDGVKDVRNQITVGAAAAPGGRVGGRAASEPDSELQSRLEDQYKKDQTLKHDNIRAEVRDGVVTLDGEVRSTADKQAAESQAWHIGNVKEVRNNLKVQGQVESAAQSRDPLAKRVEFELYSSGAFDLQKMQIHSNQGTVVLDGQVRSQAEKLLAEKIAQGVEGVKSVKDNLYVVPTPETQAAE